VVDEKNTKPVTVSTYSFKDRLSDL